jgi:hypothetical protein
VLSRRVVPARTGDSRNSVELTLDRRCNGLLADGICIALDEARVPSRLDLLRTGAKEGLDPNTELVPSTCINAVGVAGFEPTTSSSRTKRATKLRHTPREATTAYRTGGR